MKVRATPDKFQMRLIGALYIAALRGRAMSGSDFVNSRVVSAWLSGVMYTALTELEDRGVIVGRWIEGQYPRRRVYELKHPPDIAT
jgi:DNA-binding PadR family transcriptional regulator